MAESGSPIVETVLFFLSLSPYVVPQAVHNVPLPSGSLPCNCRWLSASSIGCISLSLEVRPRVCCKMRLIPCRQFAGQQYSRGREQLASRDIIATIIAGRRHAYYCGRASEKSRLAEFTSVADDCKMYRKYILQGCTGIWISPPPPLPVV